MPLYFSVPLPGPFRYSTRIGGRRRGPGLVGGAFTATAYVMVWFLKASLWLMWWMVVGSLFLCVAFYYLLFKGGVAGFKAWQAHEATKRGQAAALDAPTVPLATRGSTVPGRHARPS